MKLYFSPGACSMACHIVLREAGFEFELEKVDLARHVTAAGADFYAVTARGQVPLLQLDDGQLLAEGPVITQYLADRAGHTTLMPVAGTMARYRVMEWQNFVTSELHKGYAPLFSDEVPADAKQVLKAQLRKKFEWVDGKLAATQFLTGDAFTAADAYLYTVSTWAPFVGLVLDDLPHLQRFVRHVGERPAVRAARKAEGLPA